MGNICDYIKWRGDISFSLSPFNEVDSLILCQLSYLNFKDLISNSFSKKISLKDLLVDFENSPDYETRCDVGSMINPDTITLFELAAKSERFGDLELCAYVEELNEEAEEQFCALTFMYKNKWGYVAFRGTDDNIVGWKEDFNLAYMDFVPAQLDSINYLNYVANHTKCPLYVGGHSKGGNLAIFSSVNASLKIKKRIISVFNNDGPGFKKEFFESDDFNEIKGKILSYLPELSIVGMIFENESFSIIVESESRGIKQHDPFSWHVLGNKFIHLDELSEESKLINSTIDKWYNELSIEQREIFVESIFGLLKNIDAKTNTELLDNWFGNSIKFIKAVKDMDEKTKNALTEISKIFFKYMKEEIIDLIKKPDKSLE